MRRIKFRPLARHFRFVLVVVLVLEFEPFKAMCQIRPENDNSEPLEDHAGRKTTCLLLNFGP
jgi:hypothetical protein